MDLNPIVYIFTIIFIKLCVYYKVFNYKDGKCNWWYNMIYAHNIVDPDNMVYNIYSQF